MEVSLSTLLFDPNITRVYLELVDIDNPLISKTLLSPSTSRFNDHRKNNQTACANPSIAIVIAIQQIKSGVG